MPSVSAKQAKLMRAVAHGFKPDQFKGPSKKVAKEFTRADEAKKRKSKLNKWAHGDAKSNVGDYRT
jgi:hypothetical protein